jgi:hypothetical protein
VLYTVMPMELVFASEEQVRLRLCRSSGRVLLVREEGSGWGRVEALLSTNPQDFLDPRWQPGTPVRW